MTRTDDPGMSQTTSPAPTSQRYGVGGFGAGRQRRVPDDPRGGVREPGQRAGGNSSDRAARPAAVRCGQGEVRYALPIILAMGIGLFSPPFGVGLYGACAIGPVSPDDAVGRMWSYLAALAVALAVVVAVPWLSIRFL